MAKPSKSAKPTSNPPRPTTGLGRGLSEIIAQGARPASSPVSPLGSQVRHISLTEIIPNSRQPRMRFTEEPLDELVLSIREHGVLQPITVRPQGQQFEIIAGERRFRACQKAGLSSIPAIVKMVSDVEACELALIENLQRENLDPIEEARGYHRLANDFSLTQEQIAQKVGKNRATVANTMRLLDLPEEVQGYLVHNQLTPGHAKAILSFSDPAQQIRLAHDVIKQGLNVRRTELLVNRLRSASGVVRGRTSRSAKGEETPAHLRSIQDALQQKLATRVLLRPVGNGGKIEIQYYTPSDLARLLSILNIQL